MIVICVARRVATVGADRTTFRVVSRVYIAEGRIGAADSPIVYVEACFQRMLARGWTSRVDSWRKWDLTSMLICGRADKVSSWDEL